jgi:outer membrane lipoprotein-sorting protein
MRWLAVAVAWGLVVSNVGAQETAQQLYEAMERKLAQSRALMFQFAVETGQVKIKGSALLTRENRLKLGFVGEAGKDTLTGLMVSDGKTLVQQHETGTKAKVDEKDKDKDKDKEKDKDKGKDTKSPPRIESRATPDKLFDLFTGYFSRVGMFLTVQAVLDQKDPRPAADLKVSEFKSAGKEKLDGRDCHVLTYLVSHPNGTTITAKLWLDGQSQLPVQRQFTGKGDVRLLETYSAWDLDFIANDQLFTLPK